MRFSILFAVLLMFTPDLPAQTLEPITIKPFMLPERSRPFLPVSPLQYRVPELRMHTIPIMKLSDAHFYDMKRNRIITIIEVSKGSGSDLRIFMTVPPLDGRARMIRILELNDREDKKQPR